MNAEKRVRVACPRGISIEIFMAREKKRADSSDVIRQIRIHFREQICFGLQLGLTRRNTSHVSEQYFYI